MSTKTFALTAIFLLAVLPGGTSGETPMADEYEIKAAMLSNVFRLVDWPASKSGEPWVGGTLLCFSTGFDWVSKIGRFTSA